MCILAVAMKLNDQFPFIFAGNRDEAKSRLTATAHFWPNNPNFLAGKDLEMGGTWLGISKAGKFATLTNVRKMPMEKTSYSRGKLITHFFNHGDPFVEDVPLSAYGGFNLLYGTVNELNFVSNRSEEEATINKGIHVLSNAALNTPWPKVNALGQGMKEIVKLGDSSLIESKLLSLLGSTATYPDEELPDTGVGLELERQLSSIFILGEEYGTRTSTVIIVDRDLNCYFTEKTYHPTEEIKRFSFPLIEDSF